MGNRVDADVGRASDTDPTPDASAQEIRAFLDALRHLREDAGSPSFRKMTRTAHYSHTALAGTLSAGRLPSRELTLAFVKACDGDEDQWSRRWQRAYARTTSTTIPTDRRRPPRRLIVLVGLGVTALAVVILTVAVSASSTQPADPEACNPLPTTDPQVNSPIDDLRAITHRICAGLPNHTGNKKSGIARGLSYYVQRNPDGYVQLQLDGPATTGHPAVSVYWQENPPDNPAHPGCSWYLEEVKVAAGETSWHTTGWLCPSTKPGGAALSGRLPDPQACNPLPAVDLPINAYIDKLRLITQSICTAMPARTGVPLARNGGQTTGTTVLDGQEVFYFVQRYDDGYVQLQLNGLAPATGGSADWSVVWQEGPADNPAHPGCSPYQEQVNPTDGGPPWRTSGWSCAPS